MLRMPGLAAALLWFAGLPMCAGQTAAELHVRYLVDQACRASWPQRARLLLEADREAVQAAFGDRHYRWNELWRAERYQHDIARRLVRELRGTPAGADALVVLLGLGPYGGRWIDEREFLPDEFGDLHLHRWIIRLLDSSAWRKLGDLRLARIQAEAYETWWSLSRAAMDDPTLENAGATPADYAPGAEAARRQAIALYRKVAKAGQGQR
jgi:hypothetical protein